MYASVMRWFHIYGGWTIIGSSFDELSRSRRNNMRTFVAAILAIAMSLALRGLSLADGTEKSVTGNMRDAFCNTVMDANGPSHKQCAISCAQKGIPVVMVEKGTNKSYILIPPKNDEPLPKDVIDKMEDNVTVTGKVYEKDGVSFLQVESVK
jgi:hypothetical protein